MSSALSILASRVLLREGDHDLILQDIERANRNKGRVTQRTAKPVSTPKGAYIEVVEEKEDDRQYNIYFGMTVEGSKMIDSWTSMPQAVFGLYSRGYTLYKRIKDEDGKHIRFEPVDLAWFTSMITAAHAELKMESALVQEGDHDLILQDIERANRNKGRVTQRTAKPTDSKNRAYILCMDTHDRFQGIDVDTNKTIGFWPTISQAVWGLCQREYDIYHRTYNSGEFIGYEPIALGWVEDHIKKAVAQLAQH